MPCCCVSSWCNLGFDFSIVLDKFTIKCLGRGTDDVFACRWTMVMILMVIKMMMTMMITMTTMKGGASARLSSACLSTSSQKIDHGGSQVHTAL